MLTQHGLVSPGRYKLYIEVNERNRWSLEEISEILLVVKGRATREEILIPSSSISALNYSCQILDQRANLTFVGPLKELNCHESIVSVILRS